MLRDIQLARSMNFFAERAFVELQAHLKAGGMAPDWDHFPLGTLRYGCFSTDATERAIDRVLGAR